MSIKWFWFENVLLSWFETMDRNSCLVCFEFKDAAVIRTMLEIISQLYWPVIVSWLSIGVLAVNNGANSQSTQKVGNGEKQKGRGKRFQKACKLVAAHGPNTSSDTPAQTQTLSTTNGPP